MSKKFDCSYVMDKFLEVDKKEKIPLWMTKHFLTCEECRSNVRMFSQAENLVSKDYGEQGLFTFATIAEVKEKLYPGSTKPKKIPMIQWLIIGIFLVICMILCSLVSIKYFPEFQTFTFVFVAAFVTSYCMLFVGLNMDFFVKQ